MEQDFQTSFIPKKPIIEDRTVVARPVGFALVLSLFIFFTVLIASGSIYLYKGILVKNITKMEGNLNLAKNRFEPSKINQLQVLDKRLRVSTEILSKHLAISPIFQALQDITMKTVRFTRFGYDFVDEKSAKISVKMSGSAIGYRSIALQSDLFAKSEYFINPVFSNLSLDNSGNVLFDLEFIVDPSFVDYKEMLLRTDNEPFNNLPPNIPN